MSIRAVTFDVYSALFDTVSGLAAALRPVLHRRGVPTDPRSLAQVWRQKHMEYLLAATALQADRLTPTNRRAIEAGAAYALRALDPPVDADELTQLAAAWEDLPPWPEAVEVLSAVRAKPVVLGALSNGDADMLRALLDRLPVRFDHIISTEGGPFKPHPAVYARALRVLGVSAEEVLHVAGSATDAMGATAAGIRTVWVNRGGDAVVEPRYHPAVDARDLDEVIRTLEEDDRAR